jgi:hypothetical protein
MRWCARCGAPIDDGLLLCPECVPREHLQQNVNIELTTPPHVIFDAEGNVVASLPGSGKSTVKAFDMSGKSKSRSPLRAVEKVQWNHDRQRYERAVWLFDRSNNLYCETWFDEDTGQIAWGPKFGALDDQSVHGKNVDDTDQDASS